ncbi:MAG: hypothetical protein CL678_06740 [Bdellovibrionaceae bacterium]|nr:hypothetical protein [Pseudobdellovibrionaceae bacterium]
MNVQKSDESQIATKRLTIPIYGLACAGGGSLSLEHDLEKIEGVSKVYVNPATQEAYLDVVEGFSFEKASEVIKAHGLKHGNAKFN